MEKDSDEFDLIKANLQLKWTSDQIFNFHPPSSEIVRNPMLNIESRFRRP